MIRKPAVAGYFYPDDKEVLKDTLMELLDSIGISFDNPTKAVVAPHAGYIYSGKIAAYSFKSLQTTKDISPDIFIFGPSHFFPFEGISTGPFSEWITPLGSVPVALERVEEILNLGYPFMDIIEPTLREHSIEVELPFLQIIFKDFRIIPLTFGDVDPILAARKLISTLKEDDIIVVSTDLSHYHPEETARRMDEETLKIALKNDAEGILKREACGRYPWATLTSLAGTLGWKPEILAYGTSAETSGDSSSVVGYASLRYSYDIGDSGV